MKDIGSELQASCISCLIWCAVASSRQQTASTLTCSHVLSGDWTGIDCVLCNWWCVRQSAPNQSTNTGNRPAVCVCLLDIDCLHTCMWCAGLPTYCDVPVRLSLSVISAMVPFVHCNYIKWSQLKKQYWLFIWPHIKAWSQWNSNCLCVLVVAVWAMSLWSQQRGVLQHFGLSRPSLRQPHLRTQPLLPHL